MGIGGSGGGILGVAIADVSSVPLEEEVARVMDAEKVFRSRRKKPSCVG